MNLKKYMENRIRGWLPKEPNSARGLLRLKEFRIKLRRRKPPTLIDRVVGGLGGGGGSLVLSGILLYFLFPRCPRSLIVVEEIVGMLLLALAFSVWITDKKKKPSAKNNINTL